MHIRLSVHLSVCSCLWLSIVADDDDHIIWFPSLFCLSWALRWEGAQSVNHKHVDRWYKGSDQYALLDEDVSGVMLRVLFSVPYSLCSQVVDALRHDLFPSDMVCSKGLQFTGWNGADLKGLLEHIFHLFFSSPGLRLLSSSSL